MWCIIQICNILEDYASFHFYYRCVTDIYLWQEILGAHALCGLAAKFQNPILCGVSPVSQNPYIEYLNQFDHSYTLLIVEIILKVFAFESEER